MAKTRKLPGHRNDAADLLVVAFVEFNEGNKEDALTLAAAAFTNPDMEALAEAMCLTNNASEENITVEQILQETEKNQKTKPSDSDDEDEEKEDDKEKEGIEVSSAIRRILRRTRANTEGRTAPNGNTDDDTYTDLDTDDVSDIEGLADELSDEDEDDEIDPANPEELERDPVAASDEDDDEDSEVEIEEDIDRSTEKDPPGRMGEAIRRLEARQMAPDVRALANRLSIKGDKHGREAASAIIKTGGRRIRHRRTGTR